MVIGKILKKMDMEYGQGMIKYKNILFVKLIIKSLSFLSLIKLPFITLYNKNKIEIKFKNDKIIGEGIYKFYKEEKIIKRIFND